MDIEMRGGGREGRRHKEREKIIHRMINVFGRQTNRIRRLEFYT